MVSNTNNEKFEFKEIILPYKKFKDHGYQILDTSEGQVKYF